MAVSAAGLPKWQKYFSGFFYLTSRYLTVESEHHPKGVHHEPVSSHDFVFG